MHLLSIKRFALAAMSLVVSVALVGCEEKGPAEKAGAGLDNAAKDVKNSLDPRGPVEKAGAKVDDAVKGN